MEIICWWVRGEFTEIKRSSNPVLFSDHWSPVLPQLVSGGEDNSRITCDSYPCNDGVLNGVLQLNSQNSPHVFMWSASRLSRTMSINCCQSFVCDIAAAINLFTQRLRGKSTLDSDGNQKSAVEQINCWWLYCVTTRCYSSVVKSGKINIVTLLPIFFYGTNELTTQ